MAERQLLQEFRLLEYDPVGVKKRLKEGKNLILQGVLQRAGAKNANNRVYPREILEREISGYQQFIDERRALGELDHPTEAVVNLKNASHRMTEIKWHGDDVTGTLEVLNTPNGNILRNLIADGVMIGISSRGLGSTSKTNEGHDLVNDDFQLVAFDVVSNPSTHGSFVGPLAEGRNHGKVHLGENIERMFRIKKNLNEILRAY